MAKASPYRLSRRQALKIGVAGVAGVAAAGAWPRRLLGQSISAPYLLCVYCSGGWDPSMVFDNKLKSAYAAPQANATAGTGSASLPFVDDPSRPLTARFFKTYGTNAAIANGLAVSTLDHRHAVSTVLGTTPPSSHREVDWLTYYASALGPFLDLPHVVIDAPFMPGDYPDLAVRLTTATLADYAAQAADTTASDLGDTGESALLAFRGTEYSTAADAANPASLDHTKLLALASGVKREPLIKAALAKAQQATGAQGTDSAFLHNAKLAVDLFQQGSSLAATVQCGATDRWDTTTANFARQTAAYESLFGDLDAVLKYAAGRGIDQQLTVVVISEMGRAPQLNTAGGKDPWPYTSALIWGAGVNGGNVSGATDDALRGIAVDPTFGTPGGSNAVVLTHANVFAGIYLVTGVPLKLVAPDTPPLSTLFRKAS